MRWLALILVLVGLILYFTLPDPVEMAPERPPEPATAGPEEFPEPVPPEEVLRAAVGSCEVEGTVLRDHLPVAAVIQACDPRDGYGRSLPAGENHQQWLMEGAGPPRLLARARAGPDGRFSISGLDPGRVLLLAEAEDGAGGQCALTIAPGATIETTIAITGGTKAIAGTVRWSDGRPFQGVVWAVPKVKKYTNTRTGRVNAVPVETDGSFTVTGLPKGVAFLSFFKPGEIEMTVPAVPVPSAGLNVVVDEGFADFRGRVLAADGDEPIAGARVCLGTSKGTSATAVTLTDAEGRFRIRAPAARGGISVTADGFASWLEIWPVVGEEIEIRLMRYGRLSGRVMARADESPVAGVTVNIRRAEATTLTWWTTTVTSDAEGRFACDCAPGTMQLHVLDRGWASAGLERMTRRDVDPLRVEVEARGSAEVVVPVEPAGRARVRLIDAEGAPLAGRSISVRLPMSWPGFRHETRGTTGEGGTALIENLVPGFPYSFSAKPRDQLPVDSGPRPARSGECIEIELRAPACRWLEVRVTREEDGSPVPGALLACARKTDPYRSVGWGRTDGSGTARVGPLPIEPVTVSVHADGTRYRRPVFVPGSDRPGELPPLDLTVERGYEIAGRLVWADGTPRYYEQVKLESSRLATPWTRQVEYDGSFRFTALPGGEFTLSVVGKSDVAPVTIAAGTTDFVYRTGKKPETKRWQSLVVRVLGPEGKPVQSGTLRLPGGTGQSWPILAGRAATSYLDPKSRAISFEAVDVVGASGKRLGSALVGPFDPAEGEAKVRLGVARSISGFLFRPDGSPAHGIVVEAVPAGGKGRHPHARTHVGSDGRFVLDGLGEATYRIALKPVEGCLPEPARTVAAGGTDVVIRLRAGVDVALTILDFDGRPVAGASVFARRGDLEWRASADRNGVARLLGLPADQSLDLTVGPPQGRVDVLFARLKEWRPADETIRLERSYLVTGIVLSAAGKPVARARVYYSTHAERFSGLSVAADAQGRFRVGRLSTREVWLFAISPGVKWPADWRDRTIQVTADAADVTLTVIDARTGPPK